MEKKMKYGNFSLWDWRPWAIMLAIMALTFWLYLGYGYAQVMAGDSNNLAPISKALLGFISVETINRYLIFLILVFLATILIIVWLIVKAINSVINRRSAKGVIDDLLWQIPTRTDEEIIDYCRRLGIEITPNSAVIDPAILRGSSVEALAQITAWLLYFSYAEIELLLRRGEYTAFHCLADLLLANWPSEDTESFVKILGQHKEYLGRAFEAAWRRRDLELQVSQLEAEIEQCRQNELNAAQISSTVPEISSRFKDYDELISGKSAIVKWIKRQVGRISFGRWKK